MLLSTDTDCLNSATRVASSSSVSNSVSSAAKLVSNRLSVQSTMITRHPHHLLPWWWSSSSVATVMLVPVLHAAAAAAMLRVRWRRRRRGADIICHVAIILTAHTHTRHHIADARYKYTHNSSSNNSDKTTGLGLNIICLDKNDTTLSDPINTV